MNDTPLFGAWLASRKLVAAAGLFCALSGVLIFWLYGLPGEAIAYLLCLCCIGTSFWAVLSFVRFWRKHKILRKMEEAIFVTTEDLPETSTLIEEDYQLLIQRLGRGNPSAPSRGRQYAGRFDLLLYSLGPPDQNTHRGNGPVVTGRSQQSHRDGN